jgi:hypothetical protein
MSDSARFVQDSIYQESPFWGPPSLCFPEKERAPGVGMPGALHVARWWMGVGGPPSGLLVCLVRVDRAAHRHGDESRERDRDREQGESHQSQHDQSPLVGSGCSRRRECTMPERGGVRCDRHHKMCE